MNLDRVVFALNELLSKRRPITLNSSWIQRHAPACYRFIRKWIRNEVGAIDWDQVTHLLDSAYQQRWNPGRRKRHDTYARAEEVDLILNRYRDKLYVFIAAIDGSDRHIRDVISIALVRVAQTGNTLARQELMRLVGYTIDDWLENHPSTGFYTMFEENLAVPFRTEVLGVEVTVERIDMTDDEQIVAICERSGSRLSVPIADLPLPDPLPKGAEWIDAYRRWARVGFIIVTSGAQPDRRFSVPCRTVSCRGLMCGVSLNAQSLIPYSILLGRFRLILELQ